MQAIQTAFILALLMAGSALAEDYVVDSATSETNGGGTNPAMLATGDSLSITGAGSVTTVGGFAHATAADTDAEIENSGILSTSGQDAYGMRGNTGNRLLNSGTILTSGEWAAGIYGIDENHIFNGGTIATAGINATGMRLGTENLILNSGTISTEANGGTGIYAYGSGNVITNSGTILTKGDDARGIYAGANGTISNSGTILTEGASAYGIAVTGGGNRITHSGKIISNQSMALYLSGTGNTLHLQAPAMIGGTIRMLDPATVNILTGPSHSVHWTFEGDFANPSGMPAVAGPDFWSFNAADGTFAAYDATALLAANVFLGNLSHSVHGLAPDRIDAAAAGAGGAGATDTATNPINAWIAGFGGAGSQGGSAAALPHNFEQSGLAAGMDRDFGNFTLGAMAGASASRFDAESAYLEAQHVEVRGGFAGIYGRYGIGRVNLDLALAGGWLDFRHARAINDNLAPAGLTIVDAEYRGWWTSPAVTMSLPLEMGADWTFRPRLGVRYVAGWIDGYGESGAYSDAANATVSSRLAALGELRVGVAADRSFLLPAGTGHLGIHAGLLGRKNLGDDTTSIFLNGTGLEVADPSPDIGAGFFSATAGFKINNSARLYIIAETEAGRDGYLRHGGRLTFSAQF